MNTTIPQPPKIGNIFTMAPTGAIDPLQTTDIHLPRRIAKAMRRAHKGDLAVVYEKEGYFTHVHWTRD